MASATKGPAWLMVLAGLLLLAQGLVAQPSPILLVAMTGGGAQHRFGHSVAPAGDVAGDGYSDIIVGAPSAGTEGAGRAYLYLGGAAMDNLADAVMKGEAAAD